MNPVPFLTGPSVIRVSGGRRRRPTIQSSVQTFRVVPRWFTAVMESPRGPRLTFVV